MNRNNNQNNNYFGNNYNQGNYNRQYGNYNNGQFNGQFNNQYYNQNGQFNQNQFNQQMNNFTPYNNPNNKKKGMNKELLIKIGLGAGIAIFLLSLFFIVKGCTKSEEAIEEGNVEKEVQTVGTSEYGYVTIPNDWLRLEGTGESTGIKYSDKDIIYAVTLDTSKSLSAEEFVYLARNQLQAVGVSNFEITEVNFTKYKAYKLVGYYQESNKYILAYFFEAEDSVTHYVGVEGPDNQSEYFKILDTYKLIK